MAKNANGFIKILYKGNCSGLSTGKKEVHIYNTKDSDSEEGHKENKVFGGFGMKI